MHSWGERKILSAVVLLHRVYRYTSDNSFSGNYALLIIVTACQIQNLVHNLIAFQEITKND